MQHFNGLRAIYIMKKISYLPILVLLLILPRALQAGPIERVAELIKQGNAAELAKFFASTIDVTMMETSNVYSKTQAELVLDKFFKENKPHTVKVLHKVNSNATYNYAVLILTTDKGKFRIAYTLKELDKQMVLIELRIESEKT